MRIEQAPAAPTDGHPPWWRAFEHALDPVIGTDATGTITDWNRQAELTFGWARNEAIGRHLGDLLLAPEPDEDRRRALASFLSGEADGAETRRIETVGTRRDGSVFAAEWAAVRVGTDGAFCVFVRDLSELRAVVRERDELLQRVRNDQRFVTELSGRLACAADVETLVEWSTKALAGYLGATRCWLSEIDDAAATAVVHKDFAVGLPPLRGKYPLEAFGREMVAAWRAGGTLSVSDVAADPRTKNHARAHLALGIGAFVTVCLRRGGQLVAALNVSVGTPRSWTARELDLVRTVTESLWSIIESARLIGALQEREAQLRTITDNAASCLFMMDERGYPTFMNPAAEAVTGYRLPEIRDRPLHEAVHHLRPDGRPYPIDECPIDRAQAEFVVRRHEEENFVRKDGTFFPVSFSLSPLMRAGAIVGSVLEFQDISEEKRREEAIRDAVRARDEFISICSHELRTPVTSMRLLFQNAAKQLASGDERVLSPTAVGRRVVVANRQLERMTRLISDMLESSRIAAGRLDLEEAPVDLGELLCECRAPFEGEARALGIEIGCERPPFAVVVRGDRFRLEQVFANLLSNALKYGAGRPVGLRLSAGGGRARIEVRDQGRGLAAQDLERIFHRFERAVPARSISGLGLGLYISRQIVEAHGGRIWAESEPGRGATFVVELPQRAA